MGLKPALKGWELAGLRLLIAVSAGRVRVSLCVFAELLEGLMCKTGELFTHPSSI